MSRSYRLFWIVLCLFVVITPLMAQDAFQVTTIDNAKLRSGPDQTFEALATIPHSTTLPALSRNEGTTWIQVDYNGTQGWVAIRLLNWSGNIDSLPISGTQPEPISAASSEDVTAKNSGVVNVRSCPSTSAGRLGKLPASSAVTATGRSGTGNQLWVRFDFEGKEGWLAGWLLKISGDVNSLPEVSCSGPSSTFFNVYTDYGAGDNHFIPSGYMGDIGDILTEESSRKNPHSGRFAIKVTYTPQGNGPNICSYAPPCKWAGVYWQQTENNWATIPNVGFNLTGYNRLTFWARSDTLMQVEFIVGGITGTYPDSLQPARSTGFVALTDQWQQFTIDLQGANLSYVIGGFGWVSNWDRAGGGGSFYLDDIRFEV